MAERPTVELSSHLDAPASEVAEHATSMSGVNLELGPWIRMTNPRSEDRLPSGETGHLFDSWVLLAGLLPFDRHHLCLEAQRTLPGGGMSFVEESTTWLQRRWRHERIVEPEDSGCSVTDRVLAGPRVRFAAPVVDRLVPAIFRHRHRRLRARFGAGDARGSGDDRSGGSSMRTAS